MLSEEIKGHLNKHTGPLYSQIGRLGVVRASIPELRV